ncbi:MAG: hypothetical protein ACE5LU_09860 [Anaerolineae bacterium]
MKGRLNAILVVCLLLLGCVGPMTPTSEPTSVPRLALTSTPAITSTPTASPTSVPASTPRALLTSTLTPAVTASPTVPSIRAQATPTPSTEPGSKELTGPLLIDSEAGRLYAGGQVDEKSQTFVLAATDGRLLATFDIAGRLGLDSVHGWLYVDRDAEGLAVLDAQTGALHTTIPLPAQAVPWQRNPAPQADPATGQVLAFRDNVVYIADPETGEITRTIPFDIRPAENSCGDRSKPLPIDDAVYDNTRRILYLEFGTFVCTPWTGYTVLSYDMTAGTEIAQKHGPGPGAFPAAFDGNLYGSSWYRMGFGYRWALKDGRLWVESSDWDSGFARFQVDATRRRLYEAAAGTLRVLDAETMALIMVVPLPFEGQLVGYDPQTNQLYFLTDGQLRLWPISAVQPPAAEPLTASRPPTTAVHSLVVSPTWAQDRTLFGIWEAETMFDDCWVFDQTGGSLHVSSDGGRTWGQSQGGLRGCDKISTLGVSPDYAHDRTLMAGVVGLGIFKSTDGGQLLQPSGAGLSSMGVREILISPGFSRDRTAFARVRWGRLHRSTDGGHTWHALDVDLDPVAMSPEFDQDHILMGVARAGFEERTGLLISRDGGDHWERVGDTPTDENVSLLSLAPLFEKWHVVFALAGNDTLYRSADGGISWDAVLSVPGTSSVQLVYAPNVEVNRPVFLVAKVIDYSSIPPSQRGTLYRSGDGGITWRQVQLPGDMSPTALAISPNFIQDRLLFAGTADGQVLSLEDPALRRQVP